MSLMNNVPPPRKMQDKNQTKLHLCLPSVR